MNKAQVLKAVQEKRQSAMTVADLRKKLDEHPPTMLVGFEGHFGEFYPMKKWDPRVKETHMPALRSEMYGAPKEVYPSQYADTLLFEIPDIGPDPD